jgi:LPXTG-motif cell wall-anchored protein
VITALTTGYANGDLPLTGADLTWAVIAALMVIGLGVATRKLARRTYG